MDAAAIARKMTGWTTLDVSQAWEALNDGFMVPDIERLSAAEVREYLELEAEDEAEPGWYARLSAPGYLDCTEWTGPFDSFDDAAQYLIETFSDWG